MVKKKSKKKKQELKVPSLLNVFGFSTQFGGDEGSHYKLAKVWDPSRRKLTPTFDPYSIYRLMPYRDPPKIIQEEEIQIAPRYRERMKPLDEDVEDELTNLFGSIKLKEEAVDVASEASQFGDTRTVSKAVIQHTAQIEPPRQKVGIFKMERQEIDPANVEPIQNIVPLHFAKLEH